MCSSCCGADRYLCFSPTLFRFVWRLKWIIDLVRFIARSLPGSLSYPMYVRIIITSHSIRMTTDKHLPSVAYQIKLQRVLNEYFFGLLFLVLESNLVYELHRYGYGHWTGPIDAAAAFSVWGHNAWTLFTYYAQRNLDSEYATNRKRGNRRRRHKVR